MELGYLTNDSLPGEISSEQKLMLQEKNEGEVGKSSNRDRVTGTIVLSFECIQGSGYGKTHNIKELQDANKAMGHDESTVKKRDLKYVEIDKTWSF